jgi:hypothetical protein
VPSSDSGGELQTHSPAFKGYKSARSIRITGRPYGEEAAIRFSRQSRICMTLANEPEPRPGHFSRLPPPYTPSLSLMMDVRSFHTRPSIHTLLPTSPPFPKTADKRRGRVYSFQTSRKATQPWPGTKRSTSLIASLHTTP